MKYQCLAGALCLSAIACLDATAEPIKFARFPHASNDGKIAFSYHGDIWVAESDGANPRRLTAHVARDEFPRFSPDGKTIAFNSDRMGNDDIWTVPVEGGEPEQVTFHATGDRVQYWTPDGDGIIFSTSRGAGAWGSPLFVAPLDGSLPGPLPMDRGAAGMIRQDGRMIAFNRNGFRYWRKGYRGNYNTDIYVQDLKSKTITQLTDLDMKEFREHTQDAHPMWGADGMIYFLSERDGIFNIWRIAPGGGAPEQVTRHGTDGVQYPSISPDGRTIMYENEFELWKLAVPDGEPQRLTVDMAFDPKRNLVEYIEVEDAADDFGVSPEGEYLAVDQEGEIYIVPVDPDYGEKTQVTNSDWRDRNARYSPDGKHILYTSDKSGDEEIWLYSVEDAAHRQLTESETLKSDHTWSHDSTTIAFVGSNTLYLIDLDSGDLTELAHNENFGFSISEFSADNQWIVYQRSDENLNSDIYLFNIADKSEHNLTQHLASEAGGRLTPDGRTLVFTSTRDGGTRHLFAVSLKKMEQDPDDPLVRKKLRDEKPKRRPGRRPGGNGNGDDDGDGGGEDEAQGAEEQPKEDEAETPATTIEFDLDGIDRRARQLTRGGDDVSSFFLSKDGKTIYYTAGNALHSIGIDGEDPKKIADGRFFGMQPTADRQTIFYRQGGRFGGGGGIYKLPVRGGRPQQINFEFTVRVDHRARWEQIFEEAWRVMKYRFYDEDMHGVDWDAMKVRYKPLLNYVGENQDLYDLTNEMIGELNASHTGVSGPPSRSMERQYSTAELGFELAPDGDYYRVSHIYYDGPADKEWIDLKAGDYVLAIDGEAILAGDNYFNILNHHLNDYVNVKVASPSDDPDTVHGEPRIVRIEAAGSLRNIKYEEWVHNNRQLVDELSGGKVGYVHIRSMNRSSLARFEEEINQYWNKNGMIIDIRYNGGGNIDQQLIDILERRPYEYWNYRWGGRAYGRRPRQAIAGPKIMLINWRSASDSEVTPQGFRDLELGTIVGNPTYGAVIATGSYSLMGGARIRTPGSLVVTYDPSKPNNYGINLENYGVPPDVWVENTPQDELDGNDRELKKAVEVALKRLEEGNWQFGEDE